VVKQLSNALENIIFGLNNFSGGLNS
jgi:hypothetical protein